MDCGLGRGTQKNLKTAFFEKGQYNKDITSIVLHFPQRAKDFYCLLFGIDDIDGTRQFCTKAQCAMLKRSHP